MIISPPLASSKHRKKIATPVVVKTTTEEKKLEAEKNVPKAPGAEETVVSPKPDDDAPHSYDHIFIMEQLDRFAKDAFAEELHTLPIPSSILEVAAKMIEEFKNTCVELNVAILERNEVDQQMKNASDLFYKRA